MNKKKSCEHPDYVFDAKRNAHVCRLCQMLWRDTDQPIESSDYTFDRLLGGKWL